MGMIVQYIVCTECIYSEQLSCIQKKDRSRLHTYLILIYIIVLHYRLLIYKHAYMYCASAYVHKMTTNCTHSQCRAVACGRSCHPIINNYRVTAPPTCHPWCRKHWGTRGTCPPSILFPVCAPLRLLKHQVLH